jgi:Rrf2 family transcriptional regulator, nitric oxide-sensitive transcriptional repressor
MRLTAFTDYGLRVLMRLAEDPATSLTTEALARELALSRHHLQKVVQALARAGWVATRRGAGGGFTLAVEPATLSVGAVVRRLEEPQPLVECFRADGGACVLTPRCALRHRLARAREAFLADLDRASLSDCLVRAPVG